VILFLQQEEVKKKKKKKKKKEEEGMSFSDLMQELESPKIGVRLPTNHLSQTPQFRLLMNRAIHEKLRLCLIKACSMFVYF
jgi:uncharacterized protein YaaR (DUF327 family)